MGIGFFAPLPLALMMPFMAGQSMLMGDAFGKSYQYGKRKISAMSNEEFNKLTPADLAKDITADFTALIPELKIAMAKSTELQSLIIREMGNILKTIPDEIKNFFAPADDGGNIQTTNVSYSGSLGVPLGPKAGSPEDQFGVVRDLGKQAIKKVLPGSLGGTGPGLGPAKKHQPPPVFKQTTLSKIQLMNNTISNLVPQLFRGATSKRRKSQSSNIQLEKLKRAVRANIASLQSSPFKAGSREFGIKLMTYKKAVQNVLNWEFTYI